MATTVLIVDDHERFREEARELLTAAGYDVIGEAEDGASALAAVRELHPDVVLLDVQLPDASGFDVAEALANEPAQIVLVSVRAASTYRSRIMRSRARGFIAKPDLSPEAVEALLEAR